MKKIIESSTKLVWEDEEICGEADFVNGKLIGVSITRVVGSSGTFKVGKDGLSFVRAVYDACATILLESSAEVGSADDE